MSGESATTFALNGDIFGNRQSHRKCNKEHGMRFKAKTSSACGGAKAVTHIPRACMREGEHGKRQLRDARQYHRRCLEAQSEKRTECQGLRQEANREKRQELARQRYEATLVSATKRQHCHKLASRERLKGKGLFYCQSARERLREIQRREHEANR